ncbi:hypothetical protein EGW08_011628 [Elysia chlorotica]|uniref:Apple domain-containing protein n=1 Tax=Elysia chlorotica TaxID=188477 RepID=A0A433TGA1_ELYCH|nr:hypothetical protein EGW08_011628 [Elysia chlorotica]
MIYRVFYSGTYILLLAAFLGLTYASNVTNYRFQIQRNTRVSHGATIVSATTPDDVTLLVCAAQCGPDSQCNMFEYSERRLSCTLYSDRIFDSTFERSPSNDSHLGFRINFENITDGEWTLVFLAQQKINYSVYDAWSNTGLSHDNPFSLGFDFDCVRLAYEPGKCNQHFRSHLLDEWYNIHVGKVRYSLRKGGTEVAFIEFDGLGSGPDDWFDQTRLLNSTWGTSLMSMDYMGVQGYFSPPHTARRFNAYGSMHLNCTDQWLYATVVDQSSDSCSGEWGFPAGFDFPIFLFSPYSGPAGPFVPNYYGTYPQFGLEFRGKVWCLWLFKGCERERDGLTFFTMSRFSCETRY